MADGPICGNEGANNWLITGRARCRSSLTPYDFLLSIMASSCHVHGVVDVTNGCPFNYAQNKNLWKYDAFLPLETTDLPADFFTFGADPTPLDEGLYEGVARVVSRVTVGAN